MRNSGILVACLLVVASCDSVFNLKLLANSDAKCLDGSPGAYYVSEGSGVNRTKFVLYFEGGGWCGSKDLPSTIESCYQRSLGTLGSSKTYPQTINGGGMLSGNASANSLYYDWTRVFFKYCDGTGHQGTKSVPVSYKGADLYFRGSNITIGIFNALHTAYGLYDGSEILVSGCSAGGLAAYTWTNYLFSKSKGRVFAAPDSGMFLDEMNVVNKTYYYRTEIMNFMKLSNEEVDPPIAECALDYPTEKWRCMFAQYQFPYIRAPLFPINSLYDSWSLPNILGISCVANESLKACTAEQRAIIESYKANSTKVLKEMATSRSGNGAWAPACSNHCYATGAAWNSPSFRVPAGSAYSIQEALLQWMKNPKANNTHIDQVSWPSNSGCAGQQLWQLIRD